MQAMSGLPRRRSLISEGIRPQSAEPIAMRLTYLRYPLYASYPRATVMRSVLARFIIVALVAGIWPTLASAEGFTG